MHVLARASIERGPDGPAVCGNQRRIRRRVVGAVVAVAAGPFHMDDAHALQRHGEHFGDRLAIGIDALGMRPYRQAVLIVHQRDGA